VGGEHRGYERLAERFGNAFGGVTTGAQAGEGGIQAAVLHIAPQLVDGAAADVVAVFGQVGQMAEIRESADHADGLLVTQRFEQLFQRVVGGFVGIAAKGHTELADLLHQLVGGRTFLLANHIAQNTA
jgi:hypothetical protein